MNKFTIAGVLASALALAACGTSGSEETPSQPENYRGKLTEAYENYKDEAGKVASEQLNHASVITSISQDEIAAIVQKVEEIDVPGVVNTMDDESAYANFYQVFEEDTAWQGSVGWRLLSNVLAFQPLSELETQLETDWRYPGCNLLVNIGDDEDLPISRGQCENGRLVTATVSYEAGTVKYFGNEEQICVAQEDQCDRFDAQDRQRFNELAQAFYAERERRNDLARPAIEQQVSQLKANLSL